MGKTESSMSSDDSNESYRETHRRDHNSEEYMGNLAIAEEVLEKLSKGIDENSKNPNESKSRIVQAIAKNNFTSITIIPKKREHVPVGEGSSSSKENNSDCDASKTDLPSNARTAMEEEYKFTVQNIENNFARVVNNKKRDFPCKNRRCTLLECLESNPRETLKCSEIAFDFMNCINKQHFYDRDA